MYRDLSSDKPVAYFCAEYGFKSDLPLYAGGLGVLAGDTVKAAADQSLPFVAVGLMYRGGNAKQILDAHGWQTEKDVEIDPVSSGFEHVYDADDPDQPLFVRVHLTTQDVWARVWKRTVNKSTLYLLDTYTDQNAVEDRGIAHALYFGSEESLIKQQLVLGIGGVKLLTSLNIEPRIFHVNEGRPAFLHWQLIRKFMDRNGMSYEEAKEKAKSSTVYTNHTLVRAGNQAYDSEILRNYGQYYAEKMGVSIDELLSDGIDKSTSKFSLTEFALNTSRKASAVSKVHYELSKNIWPEYSWVGITNGVHLPTWQDEEIAREQHSIKSLWKTHKKKKRELSDFVKEKTGYSFDPSRLVISWARRIAGYKRPNALFEDITRFANTLKNKERPVQLLMAGRAHVKDESAKKMLQMIVEYMQEELSGHALFIPNYDIDVSQMMVRGSDVWVNTPTPGQEASGTSGMKAAANGVLQLTVEDGWTAEVDWQEIGWTLDGRHLSDSFYLRLEHDIISQYYNRGSDNIPHEWVSKMQKSIGLAHKFSSKRMLQEYQEMLYAEDDE
ncbi:alpha-glucan family phosphorylase [Patescibacteria group bacterium]